MRGVHYARVSDPNQVHGVSLDAQQEAGREWFRRQGGELARMFREEGQSGRSRERTSLLEAFDFIRKEQKAGRVLNVFLVQDLSRFCRNLEDQHWLKKELRQLGVRLESVAMALTDNAHGRFMQNTLGAAHEFQVDYQGEKIAECMLARKRQGRWPHQAPIGYRNRHNEDGSRKWIEPDPDAAPLIRQAFEAIARGERLVDVLSQVNANGLRTRRTRAAIRMQELRDVLQNPIYAGKIRSPKYGLEVDGEHEAIVDAGTWYRVRERMAGGGVPRPRRRDHVDFPLRGFVRCEGCGKPLTAGWAGGRTRRYPYYWCWFAGCRKVKAPAARIEKAMVAALDRLRVGPAELEIAKLTMQALLASEAETASAAHARAGRRAMEIRTKRDRLVEAYLYEKVIDAETYKRQKAILDRELSAADFEQHSPAPTERELSALLDHARPVFLAPSETWRAANYSGKRFLQALIYPDGAVFGGGELLTPLTATIYSALRPVLAGDSEMVEHNTASLNTAVGWLRELFRLPLPENSLAVG